MELWIFRSKVCRILKLQPGLPQLRTGCSSEPEESDGDRAYYITFDRFDLSAVAL